MDEFAHPVDGSRVLRVKWEVGSFDWPGEIGQLPWLSMIHNTKCTMIMDPNFLALVQFCWTQKKAVKGNKVKGGGKKRKQSMVEEFDSLTYKEQCDRKDAAYKRLQKFQDHVSNYRVYKSHEIVPSSVVLSMIAWYLMLKLSAEDV